MLKEEFIVTTIRNSLTKSEAFQSFKSDPRYIPSEEYLLKDMKIGEDLVFRVFVLK